MSGYLCIINLDGEPVDPELLSRLTRSMAFRGPDGVEFRIVGKGHVGLAHAMLRCTVEADRESQPCSLADGPVSGSSPAGGNWIVADCRVDARTELIGELRGAGRFVPVGATDPELILHAYAAWGEDCVLHLLGDFAFAIWDSQRRRLFCARDQLGTRLLYYARCGNTFLCGNTFNTLRLHPAVSARLNELAVADFLIYGFAQDPAMSTFADIHRLPAAHRLVVGVPGTAAAGGVRTADIRTERYWTLPVDPPLLLSRRRDYPERYLSLLETVVKDRMRTDNVAIMMSGGLDSTSIAAMAVRLATPATRLQTYTNVFDRLTPDQERHFASLAARHLNLPVRFLVGDDVVFYAEDFPDCGSPVYDPAFMPLTGDPAGRGTLNEVSDDGFRVAFYGEGPDGALHYEWKPYVNYLLDQGRYFYLLQDMLAFPFLFGQLPMTRRKPRPATGSLGILSDELPSWLKADFVARLGLRERVAELSDSAVRENAHPFRPEGYAGLSLAIWQFVLEQFDAGVSGVPVDVRHPFLDVRILRFLLSLPAVPWCRDKYVMRRAMQGMLPAEVVKRPKQGLQASPMAAHWREAGEPPVFTKSVNPDMISGFVDLDILRTATCHPAGELWRNLRPLALAFFLRKIGG